MPDLEKILRLISLIFLTLFFTKLQAETFDLWLDNFKKKAIEQGVSKNTVNNLLSNAKYLDKVIYYDNKQPEFFEKTNEYINKRSTNRSVKKAKQIYVSNKKIFDKVEKEFQIEKELLLALWSIETNYGKHFGKMDTISSLATLSYDLRRRDFFTNQLLILLKLVDEGILEKENLFGSWAGAIGNFQFMPSTIKSYGIDYDNDNKIDLKRSIPDSVASAANYLNRIGWKKNQICYLEIDFSKPIKTKYLNKSARNIKFKKEIKFWIKNGVITTNKPNSNINKTAIIIPDGNLDSPKFLITENYEKILNWNRSLRFALTVCHLKNRIKNEI